MIRFFGAALDSSLDVPVAAGGQTGRRLDDGAKTRTFFFGTVSKETLDTDRYLPELQDFSTVLCYSVGATVCSEMNSLV